MKDELDILVSQVRLRWLLWTIVRVVSVLAGAAAAVLWLDASLHWLWLACLAPLFVFGLLPQRSEIPQLIDSFGGHDGQVQCAYDHRSQDEPIVLAQRARALRAARTMAIDAYAPSASAAWAVPVLLLVGVSFSISQTPSVVALTKTRPAPSEGTTAGPASTSQELDEDKRAVGSDRGRSGQLTKNSGTENKSGDVTPSAGRKTGTARSGKTGAVLVPRDGANEDATRLVVDSQIRRRSSHASDEAIAEPARPFPPKYQSVIADWFNRRTQ